MNDPNSNNPNTNKPDDNNELSQHNLKELYEIFQTYMNSQFAKNMKQRMLIEQKYEKKTQIEDYLDHKVIPDYNTQYDNYHV
jgi:hypothetical protein